MSEPKPRFGDVYKHHYDNQYIMVIGPAQEDGFFQTITIVAEPGEEEHALFGFGVIEPWFIDPVDGEWERV
jgi:hypothetical protein